VVATLSGDSVRGGILEAEARQRGWDHCVLWRIIVSVHFYRTLRRRRVEVDEGMESGRIGVDDSAERWSSAWQWNIAPMEESGPNTE
jgi:hypothetical protein